MNEAGRELDVQVAEKVMGWEKVQSNEVAWFGKPPDQEWTTIDIPNYSTDIAAAWQVLEHFGQAEYYVAVECLRQNSWRCIITGREQGMGAILTNHQFAHAETAPLAICLAALKVAGE